MAAELFPAIKRGDRAAVERMLAADPSLAMACEEGGVSAVLTAYYHGHADVADAILAKGPPLDIYDAATAGDATRVADALDRDPALANAHAKDGFTALGLAAFFRRRDVLRLLLDRGADPAVAATNRLAVTPLHSAVADDAAPVDHEIVRRLLDAGAPVNAGHLGGGRPLHTVAFTGDVESARMLLAHGADRSLRTDDGKTAADIARERGHLALAEML